MGSRIPVSPARKSTRHAAKAPTTPGVRFSPFFPRRASLGFDSQAPSSLSHGALAGGLAPSAALPDGATGDVWRHAATSASASTAQPSQMAHTSSLRQGDFGATASDGGDD